MPDPGRGYHARMAAFDSVVLTTQRLSLRPLRPDDAPALLAICSDPQVMRYWSSPPWEAIGQAEALIARDREAMASGQYLRLGIERDGGLIGYCTLFQLDAQNRRAELGYVLAAAAWSQGYMREALRALLDYGFDALDLHRIEADTDPRNRASVRCLERLGFVREGLLRERWIVAGEVSDTALYGLLRQDWRANPL
ncbi:GNAT family protein [Lysobacter sp. BMK333-48F3]|uniref:GNAT family N-acetyltransferase n=1 Tax=Lysobacter sp. BMK333-48F3 TaxID=2867962 RepID=UPI002105C281|nr:GNAT family protein [Lysobacter sp. BMK333-48F3]